MLRRPETIYLATAGLALAAFIVGSLVLATTLPYHDYDSFAFGEWSRAIAEHGKIDPLWPGPLASSRPLFYELQGALWSVTGISFTAGRLLSFLFALLYLAGVAALAHAAARSRLVVALAVVAALAVPAFTANALSGQTDVPAAAGVAWAAALALRPRPGRRRLIVLAMVAALAVLAKQTALIPLVPLTVALAAEGRTPLSRRATGPAGALGVGLVLGLLYDLVTAVRYDLGPLTYLRTGSGGIWAELADQTRGDAVLRADVLGEALRLPLLFALVYAVLRVTRVPHRTAGMAAWAVALAWGIAGPLAAGVAGGPFHDPESAFTFVGFAVVLGAAVMHRKPSLDPRSLVMLLALALPPLAVWVAATTYADRLAAPAWPALAVLTAACLAAAIELLAAGGVSFALAPVTVLVVAAWMALAGLDGLSGTLWREYRSLGWGGARDPSQTLNVVLPALQQALATAEPELDDGRLVSQDPRFAFFLPGRVDTRTPLHCSDLVGERVFVLLTADESEHAAREAGGLATPAEWAACKTPRLRQLSDGSNGYAVFAVD